MGKPTEAGDAVVYVPITPTTETARFPAEKKKCALSFLYLAANLLITTVSIIVSNQRLPDREVHPPLPDATFELVERQSWGIDVTEALASLLAATWWLVIFFHKHRWILLRRAFFLLGTLYLYRCVTFLVTSLPPTYEEMYCPPKSESIAAHLRAHVLGVLTSGSSQSTALQHRMCGNYIFSGHTVFIVLHALFINEYSPRTWFPLHWLSTTAAGVAVAMILVAHEHYTVDIVIAYYVTTRMFNWYHVMASSTALRTGTDPAQEYINRMWLFKPVSYLESSVTAPVPSQFDCPLPNFVLPQKLARSAASLLSDKHTSAE